MSAKRHEQEHEEENSERWLLTYSDLITLLLALFIILYSIAQVDAKKFNAIAEQFHSQMGDNPGGGTGTVSGVGTGADFSGAEAMSALDQVYQALNEFIVENDLQQQIELDNTDRYVRIHIRDTLMFVPDSAILLDESRPLLENIEKAIAQVYENVDYVTFSGHTADVGGRSLADDQISWRLSTERAITVLNDFIGYGLPQKKLSIQGFAHFSPIAANDTEEGRAKNRRVEITIYKYPDGGQDQFQRDLMSART